MRRLRTALLAGLLVMLLLFLSGCESQESKYREAEKELSAGNYSAAAEMFQEMGEFEHAAKYTLYAVALQAIEDGNYSLAETNLTNLEDFKSSKMYSRYNQARAYQSVGDFAEAIEIYIGLGTFADCASRIEECNHELLQKAYDKAEENRTQGNLEDAMIAFEQLREFSDAPEKVVECSNAIWEKRYAEAQALFESGAYEEAKAAFLALGEYSDSAHRASEMDEAAHVRDYAAAVALFLAEEYEDAHEAFVKLGDYSDSESQAKAMKDTILKRDYAAATALFLAEKYEDAHEAFVMLGDYSDSEEMAKQLREKILERDYQAAAALEESEKYEKALIAYRKLDGYLDSGDRASKMIEKVIRGWNEDGYQYVSFGHYPQAEDGEPESIVWRILSDDNAKLLLHSEFLLDYRRIGILADTVTFRKTTPWKETELYEYLNTDMEAGFIGKAFSTDEISLLQKTEELGSVFILSVSEMNNSQYGYRTSDDRKAQVTPYVRKAYQYSIHEDVIGYWTRETKEIGNGIMARENIGADGNASWHIDEAPFGIRPACYIPKDSLNAGTGTKDDPFRIE